MTDQSNAPGRPLPAALTGWTACPVCGGALGEHVDEPGAQPNLVCRGECSRSWYANPKPTANALVQRADDGRLLLVRRGRAPFQGCWDIPGGFVEDGEEAAAAAVRELREETGLVVQLQQLVGVFGDTYGDEAGDGEHTLNIFWRATASDPDSAAASSDVSELAWFEHDQLPADDQLAFRCVPRALSAWHAIVSAGR